jgi:hypothetical protein
VTVGELASVLRHQLGIRSLGEVRRRRSQRWADALRGFGQLGHYWSQPRVTDNYRQAAKMMNFGIPYIWCVDTYVTMADGRRAVV